jgi:ribosomal protein S18 acetylase RimI-like enzyme
MDLTIRQMTVDDYEAVRALWDVAGGVDPAVGDARCDLARFLERNPGLSFVALAGENLIGAVLCGHDGRRGYVHHLTVDESFRRRGAGRALIDRCLDGLRAAGIGKCHIFIRRDNGIGFAFWQRAGWVDRTELRMMSGLIGPPI